MTAHILWSVQADAVMLFAVAACALSLALIASRRRRVAGANGFAWMMLAVTVWVGLSGVHRILDSVDARVLTAQFQYLGIASVGPLWLLFCRRYAGRPAMPPDRTLALWIVPALTVAAVFTNGEHHLYWRDVVAISPNPADGVNYIYGPLFYVAAAYAYTLIALGTWYIFRAIPERAGPFRRESVVMSIAATVPLIVNAIYLARLTPDLTPMAFAASGGLFGWQLLRGHFLDLTPIARGLLFDRLHDAVFVLDPEYRILDANAQARSLAAGDAPIGARVSAILPWWSSFIGGETRHPESPSLVRAGACVFDVAVTPVTHADGGLAGWLVVIRDVTRRLSEEEERRTLDRRLQDQQHTESLTLLAGGLAHDFNNVLAGIMGNADLLMMKLPLNATELRELTRTITVGSERAADLVAKMLAYSGQGAGPAVLMDLDAVTHEMVDLLRASVVREGTLVHETSGPMPLVAGDATQVRQIVMNLIVNAADAVEARSGPPGTVIVRTAHDTLPDIPAALRAPAPPATLPAGRYVRIEVADTGVGMSEDTRARMFDPFYSTKASGRGLGLAAVQGIVRSHRGALAVHTVPGEGTTIRVWLPVA